MIQIGIFGALGRMGREIALCLENDSEAKIGFKFDKNFGDLSGNLQILNENLSPNSQNFNPNSSQNLQDLSSNSSQNSQDLSSNLNSNSIQNQNSNSAQSQNSQDFNANLSSNLSPNSSQNSMQNLSQNSWDLQNLDSNSVQNQSSPSFNANLSSNSNQNYTQNLSPNSSQNSNLTQSQNSQNSNPNSTQSLNSQDSSSNLNQNPSTLNSTSTRNPQNSALCGSDFKALFENSAVIIDFSSPKGTKSLLEFAANSPKPLVIGTTGLDDATNALMHELSAKMPIFYATNMSLGVALLNRLVFEAASVLKGFDIEILEMHHRHKKDAPSGTAMSLAQNAAKARNLELSKVRVSGRDGIVGQRSENEIAVMSLRGGDIVGRHVVGFYEDGEFLELAHTATSRATFAKGAVKIAKWLVSREAGLYAMSDFLGL